jgi:predicted acetyltransferase
VNASPIIKEGAPIACSDRRARPILAKRHEQILSTERAQELGRLLLTCDEGNHASEKTIRKAGGVFEDRFDPGDGQPPKKRFWIDLAKRTSGG